MVAGILKNVSIKYPAFCWEALNEQLACRCRNRYKTNSNKYYIDLCVDIESFFIFEC